MKKTIKHLRSLDTVSAKPSIMMTSMGSGIFDESGDYGSGQFGSGDHGGEQIEAGSVDERVSLTLDNAGVSSHISFTLRFIWTEGSITNNPKPTEVSGRAVGELQFDGDIVECNTPTVSCVWRQGYEIHANGSLSYKRYKRDSSGKLIDMTGNGDFATEFVQHNFVMQKIAHVNKINNENH
jgi:hypothetical protein